MRHNSMGNSSGSGSRPSPGLDADRFGSTTLGRSGVSDTTKKVAICILGVVWVGLFALIAVRALRGNEQPQAVATQAKVLVIEKPAQIEMVDILVPVKDIPANSPLQPEDFIRVSRPKGALGSDVLTSFEALRGNYARENIKANQPLVRSLLSKTPGINIVVQNIPPGYRAVAINVNATTGVEGWARAGARVDVEWIGVLRGEKVARRLVENTKILSAERKIDPKADPLLPVPTTVTLLVAERDAQRVSLAQAAGTLVLLLRGAEDVHGSSSEGTLTWGDLINGGSLAGEKSVQGVVRVKEKNGSVKEFAIVDGAVMKRKSGEK